MSIIYEALNKTQQKRETIVSSQITSKPNKKWYNLRIYLFTSIGIGAIGLAYMAYSNYGAATDINAMIDKPLVLNGVFLIGSDKYAMINNEEYKVGDKINNMSIVSIDMNNVKLQSASRQIKVLAVS